jgi:voltage-gated potassium channel
MIAPMVLRLLGIAGVPPGDNDRTYLWERRLHGVMIGIVLASVLSLFLAEASGDRRMVLIGEALEWGIFLGFGSELVWMMYLSNQKLRYLQYNWLDLMIVVCSGLALAGAGTQWVALARLLRLTTVALVLARAGQPLRKLFSPGGMPYVFALAVLAFLIAGAGFYWLEPSVNSYGAGLWLAFVTGATVGYGDIVPTSTGARLFAVLIVLAGLTMFSLVTASIAAFFIGEEEKTLGREMHRDIQQVKQDMAQLIGDQEAQLRREMHADIRRLREEVMRLREELGNTQRREE